MADCRVGFEKTMAVLEGGRVAVYPRDSEKWLPTLSDESMYMKKVEYFLTTIISGEENTVNTPESAAQSVRLAEKLKASAKRKGAVIRFW